MKTRIKNIVEILLKFRWLIAGLLFFSCVIFKIHFSSIEMYNRYFPTVTNAEEAKNYRIFGQERGIRSDEWLVHTPKCFSQEYNNYKTFSKRGSISPTNTIIDYYIPAIDLTLIGKPFNLGYILFGPEYGLSFYFCMLVILLFMTSFEMFLILTKRRVLVSTVGMIMVGLSPAMGWWMIPHMPIVFVYAMSIFSLGYYFITSNRIWQKIVFCPLLLSALVGFCLSIFPSCQVVCGFVIIFMLAATLIRDIEKVKPTKELFIRAAGVFLAFIIIILYFIAISKDALHAIMSTAYPGSRFCVGGERNIIDIFPNLVNLFLPYKDVPFENNCEVSTFIHFFPILIFLYPKIRNSLKKNKDRQIFIGDILVSAVIIEIIYMCVGFSPILSKITLLKYANRMDICYGWTATIFTIWCFSIIYKQLRFNLRQCILYPLIYGAIFTTLITDKLIGYYDFSYYILEIAIFVIILFFVMKKYEKLASLSISIVMVYAGFFINPIARGISPITNHPISEFVSSKVENAPDDVWLSFGNDASVIGSFLKANGARVLSSVNFYPDMEKWKLLNMDDKYYNVYNRYAHQNFFLTEGEQYIEVTSPDSIKIYINKDSLKNLNVRYIVAHKGYIEGFSIDNLKKVFTQDDYVVYSLAFS